MPSIVIIIVSDLKLCFLNIGRVVCCKKCFIADSKYFNDYNDGIIEGISIPRMAVDKGICEEHLYRNILNYLSLKIASLSSLTIKNDINRIKIGINRISEYKLIIFCSHITSD